MTADPEVKLKDLSGGDSPRLSVRFRSVQSILLLYKQVRDSGAFSLTFESEPPKVDRLPVLFRTKRRGEEFPAAILSWGRRSILLRPDIPLDDFKALTSSLVGQLSSEVGRASPGFGPSGSGAVERSPGGAPSGAARRPAPPDPASGSFQRAGSAAASGPADPAGRPTDPTSTGATRSVSDAFGPAPSGVVPGPWSRSESTSMARFSASLASGLYATLDDPTIIPEGAFRFLDELEIDPRPTAQGEGTGVDALTALLKSSSADRQTLLVAEAPSDGQRWYFIAEGTRVRSAYLMPPSRRSSLALLLARQGLLSEQTALDVLQKAADEGIQEEAAIEAIGGLDPSLLTRAVAAKAKLLAQMLRVAELVRFRVHQLQTRIAVRSRSAAPEADRFRRLVNRYEDTPWDEMDEVQRPHLSAYPVLTPKFESALDRLPLDDKGRQFVFSCLTGEYPLREIPKVSSLSRPRTLAIIFALYDLGFVTFDRVGRDELKARQLAATIEAQFEKIGSVDDFQFIGVHWTATEKEIAEAIAELRADLDPNKVPGISPSAFDQSGKIGAELDRIAKALESVESRRAYRKQILEPFAVEQAVELILSNFDMALYRGARDEIRQILTRLKELDPQAALEAREKVRSGKGTVGF